MATRRDNHLSPLSTRPRASLSEPLLRPQDAADLLSVRLSWVYEAVRDGRLPCIHIGRHIRFLRTDLERWVDDQR
jgi:excisionase family DNA binding protein